jgi:hypothetical protein
VASLDRLVARPAAALDIFVDFNLLVGIACIEATVKSSNLGAERPSYG